MKQKKLFFFLLIIAMSIFASVSCQSYSNDIEFNGGKFFITDINEKNVPERPIWILFNSQGYELVREIQSYKEQKDFLYLQFNDGDTKQYAKLSYKDEHLLQGSLDCFNKQDQSIFLSKDGWVNLRTEQRTAMGMTSMTA